MLGETNILPKEEAEKICDTLQEILQDIESGALAIEGAEDIHTFIEQELVKRIGVMGKRMHTARSRNDQVATDFRLYVKDSIRTDIALLRALVETLVKLAEGNVGSIMPGYTHMRRAQPISTAQYLNAYSEMFLRDIERFADCFKRTDVMPLGSCALAGTDFPIDRTMTAKLMNFARISQNSLDAVSDRDFCIEFTAAASLIMMHISRLSEELIYWMSQRFRFMMLPDRFTTGSSIMPQKKNPDVAETARGKAGRVTGDLISLTVLMKGLPLAYAKDTQEDKEPVFDAIDTVKDTLRAFIEMMPGVTPNREEMKKAAQAGYPTATDLADYLTKKGLPFREAHDVVGSVVKLASNRGCDLAELSLEELKGFSDLIEEDVYEKALKLESSVAARDHVGATAPNQVRKQVARWTDIFNKRHTEPKHKRLADLLQF